MPRVGFEPTIRASKRAKTVHTLDHSAAVTGTLSIAQIKVFRIEWSDDNEYALIDWNRCGRKWSWLSLKYGHTFFSVRNEENLEIPEL
jgi:hypothetical protein